MRLNPFKLERYFAKYEFSAKYLLSSSDCDGLDQKQLLQLADEETKQLWNNLHLGYTESLGHPLLRQEISGLYSGINSSQVLAVVPEEGIFIALNTILEKGDHVICTFPGYQSLYEVAQGLGCEVTKWQPDESQNWRFDPEFLTQNIKPNTKLIIWNFPHNPTGSLLPKPDFDRMIEIAKSRGIYVFSDEMYRMLEFNQSDRLPSASEVYEKAVTLAGMSKVFGMAGARIGWLTTKDKELYQHLATFKDYLTICSSAPSEILSIIALRSKDRIISNHLKRIERNLKVFETFMDKHQNLFDWIKPTAGTICFPKLKTEMGAEEFCDKVVTSVGIMILPSTVYDYNDRHVRIGFGRENFPEALSVFDQLLSTVLFRSLERVKKSN